MRIFFVLFFLVSPGILCSNVTYAHERNTNYEDRLAALERQNQQHKSEFEYVKRKVRSSGPALFLFAAFCALWAQNTRRNAWLWFFLGLFFSVITVFFVLHLNSQMKSR